MILIIILIFINLCFLIASTHKIKIVLSYNYINAVNFNSAVSWDIEIVHLIISMLLLFKVPAELLDEVYMHMMDSHADALDQLLNKRASGDE